MRRYFVPGQFRKISFSVLILIFISASWATAQDSDPKIISEPKFVLSPEAIAAGIDGVFKTNVSIDDAGIVKNVRLYGEPIWPCGTSPGRELKQVRDAVEAHLRQIKFSPWIKNGKPRAADVRLDFAIGDAFRRLVAADFALADGLDPGRASRQDKTAPLPRIVNAGNVTGRAVRLIRPPGGIGRGIIEVQVLIDEQGNVSKAGVLGGDRRIFGTAREAACASKFEPTRVEGKAVQVTGRIAYIFQ
jgi:hypothetical protein